MSEVRPLVVGLAGSTLKERERRLFEASPPAGFILFARNIVEPKQLESLTAELRGLFPDRWVPVLTDQEGGRVQRLAPPHWQALPPAGLIGRLAGSRGEEGSDLVRAWARALATDLADAGIDVACTPVLDVAREETTAAIGDRSFGDDPRLVARLGRITIDELAACGVAPVIKHIPGHGRARVDSHLLLPVVDAALHELEEVDLVPFLSCRHAPFAMTAHVLVTALDDQNPATQSKAVIERLIRGAAGFKGVLMSDDLDMQALRGEVVGRATAALEAGCDLALHCSGEFEAMQRLLDALPVMPETTFQRLMASKPASSEDSASGSRQAHEELAARLAAATREDFLFGA